MQSMLGLQTICKQGGIVRISGALLKMHRVAYQKPHTLRGMLE